MPAWPGGSSRSAPWRATSCGSGNHHHVVCRLCGTIADVDCAVGETPCLTASDDHGFMIDEAEVIYWGRCPACQAENDQPDPTRRSTK